MGFYEQGNVTKLEEELKNHAPYTDSLENLLYRSEMMANNDKGFNKNSSHQQKRAKPKSLQTQNFIESSNLWENVERVSELL